MALTDDISAEVSKIFAQAWSERDGQVVPEADGVGLGNVAVKLKGTVLYADLAESTMLVDEHADRFAAEIYKTYLYCAAKIIRHNTGVITAYDGDRIMAVFIGARRNTRAARSALQINHCVTKIINPKLKAQYPRSEYVVKQAVGVDTSDLFVARTGIRGSNDLVWVGRAANYAAKLYSLRSGNYASWITEDVYNVLAEDAKFGGADPRDMWEARTWTTHDMRIYRSNWTMRP